jgi:hypothetical protein
VGRRGGGHKVITDHFLSSPCDCPQSLGNHDAIKRTLAEDTHVLRFAINNIDRKL